jgi:tetratricopeptide (TPR) repeat protein
VGVRGRAASTSLTAAALRAAALTASLTGALSTLGCGAATSRRSPAAAELVTMDPVHVTASREPARLGADGAAAVQFDAYDARELLTRGNDALDAASYQRALELYDRLVAEFPESLLASAARYNAALALDRAGDLAAAADRYERLAEAAPLSADAVDALFQAARCHERLEHWDRAEATLARLTARDDLSPDQRVEALARRGAALVADSRGPEAEVALRRAVALSRGLGVDGLRTDYYLAQAQHLLGEIPRRAIAEIPLSNDEARFREALERRCALLLAAQVQYVQAIRVGNAHWGAASAYRIGEMYSTLYDDVMAVPVPDVEVPPDLTHPEEVEAFRDEFPRHYRRLLREYLEPLLHSAIRWWESNLMMVERTGVTGPWADETRERLDGLQRLLDADAPAVAGPGRPGASGDGLSAPDRAPQPPQTTDDSAR